MAIYRDLALVDAGVREQLAEALDGKSPWPVLIQGPAGVGKTCAALAVADYVLGGAFYETADGLHDMVIRAEQGRLVRRVGLEDRRFTPELVWAMIEKYPFVVLDEFGARDRVSDANYKNLKRAIDLRDGKPLVVISNLSLDDLGRVYDARILSRIACGTIISVVGEDRRFEEQP